jgi:hypothetical protein
MKMELIPGSEKSTHSIQTPGLYPKENILQIGKSFPSCSLKCIFLLLLVSSKLCPLACTLLIIVIVVRRENTLKTRIRLEYYYKLNKRNMISGRGTDLCASGQIQLTSLLSEYPWSRSLINVMHNERGYTKRASFLVQTEI